MSTIPEPSGPTMPQLANRLGPRRRPTARPQPSQPPAAAAEPATDTPAEQQAPASGRAEQARTESARRAPAESRPARQSPPARKSRHVQISLPADLEPQLREYARENRLTKAAVVFRAITALREDLPRLVSERIDAPLPEGVLFRGAVADSKTRRHVPTAIYMTAEDLATLDGLGKDAGAPDRSSFVATALQAWFATSHAG